MNSYESFCKLGYYANEFKKFSEWHQLPVHVCIQANLSICRNRERKRRDLSDYTWMSGGNTFVFSCFPVWESLFFLARLVWSDVCQSIAQIGYHITVRGTSVTQRRLQSDCRFRPVASGNGTEFDGGWFFPPWLQSPEPWIVLITHQVNRQHPRTDYIRQRLIERKINAEI